MSVNLEDIARIAGVSTATVSRIINNTGNVKPANREKVLRVIEEYHYTPNPSAQNLMKKKTNTIGVIVTSMVRDHWTHILAGIDDRIYELMPAQNALVMSLGSVSTPEQQKSLLSQKLALLIRKRCDGIIIAINNRLTEKDVTALKASSIPYVIIQDHKGGSAPISVGIDNTKASYDMIERLIRLGHKRIAYVSSPTHYDYASERKAGYLQAMSDHGIGVQPEYMIEGNNSFECGSRSVEQLFSLPRKPTAVVYGTDRMAFGAIHQLNEMKVSIPKDVSIAGFDGIAELGDYHSMVPPLNTVLQPAKQLGETSVDLLYQAMNGIKTVQSLCIGTRFIDRQTYSVPGD